MIRNVNSLFQIRSWWSFLVRISDHIGQILVSFGQILVSYRQNCWSAETLNTHMAGTASPNLFEQNVGFRAPSTLQGVDLHTPSSDKTWVTGNSRSEQLRVLVEPVSEPSALNFVKEEVW